MLMCRTARYVPPAIQACPSADDAQTNCSSSAGVKLLAVPSLKPKRLRGVVPAGTLGRKPLCSHAMRATPRAMRASMRTACSLTCGSSEHACTHRSPPTSAGSSWSPGNVARRRLAGLAPAMPKRSTPDAVRKRLGPNPKVTVRLLAESPTASPVSSGIAAAGGKAGPTGWPAIRELAADVHAFSSATRSARDAVTSEKAATQAVRCCGVMMPGWRGPRKE